jgi:hypothetical protein
MYGGYMSDVKNTEWFMTEICEDNDPDRIDQIVYELSKVLKRAKGEV